MDMSLKSTKKYNASFIIKLIKMMKKALLSDKVLHAMGLIIYKMQRE